MKGLSSAAFDAALAVGAVPVVTATASFGGVVRQTGLQILPGAEITVDGGAAVRRTIRCHIADATGALVPTGPGAILSPFGGELTVTCGLVGFPDQVPVGVFRIEDVTADSLGLIQISGSDRASAIAECKFDRPYTVAYNTNLVTAITNILTAQYPGTLTTNFTSSAATAPGPVVFMEGADPWAECQSLAASMGMELFFDQTGVCVMRPVISATAKNTIATYAPGVGSMLLKVTTRLFSKGVKNESVVIGQGTGVAASAIASSAVSDPNNFLYASPQFGKRPDIITSPVIGTIPAAQTAADARLLQVAGSGEVTQFSAVPHPAHDAGDLVRLTYAPLKIDAGFVLNHYAFALGLDKEVTYDCIGKRGLT